MFLLRWGIRSIQVSMAIIQNQFQTESKTAEVPYENIKETADFLLKNTDIRPKVGIICGSGLSSMADYLCDAQDFNYNEIPNFPQSTVEGHAGRLVFGWMHELPVVAMQGRFHYYEGYSLERCAMPVRVMKLMGVQYLMATNAAGSINSNYKVGDIMILRDHINMLGFAGNSPLRGPNEQRFGPRFPPMTNAYDSHLIRHAKMLAKEMGIENNVHEGVYACLGGPTYESPAELRALRTLGVDAVGMSTVHEVVIARHCGMNVFAFSLITNKGILEYDSNQVPNHEEVVAMGKARQKVCGELMCRMICEVGREVKRNDERERNKKLGLRSSCGDNRYDIK